MNFRHVITGVFCGLLLSIGLSSCKSAPVKTENISEFVTVATEKVAYLDRRIALENWELYSAGSSDSLDYFIRTRDELFSSPRIFRALQTQRTQSSDGIDALRVRLLYQRSLRSIVDNTDVVRMLADSIAEHWRTVTAEFENQTYTVSAIEQLIKSEPNRLRRQQAYTALLNAMEPVADAVARLARLRKQTAASLGYNSYWDLMIQANGLETEWLESFIDELERRTRDLYARKLDSLTMASGVDRAAPWDIAFISRQNRLDALDPFFPATAHYAMLSQSFIDMGFDLDSWPIYFNSARIALPQTGQLLPVHVPDDIRIVTALDDGYQHLLEFSEIVTQALYLVHIEREETEYAAPASESFALGMSDFISRLISSDAWLMKYGGIPAPTVRELSAIKSFRALYELRRELVGFYFEKILYDDPFADLNRLYADLYSEIMMMSPGTDGAIWALGSDLVSKPVSLPNRLLGQGIAAQTHAYIEEKYGSVMASERTREFLVQNYYRFGRSEDWQTLISRGTGDDLTPKYLAESYGD